MLPIMPSRQRHDPQTGKLSRGAAWSERVGDRDAELCRAMSHDGGPGAGSKRGRGFDDVGEVFAIRCAAFGEGDGMAAERAASLSISEGLSTVPGQMALTRMPFEVKSAASALVMPMTAALVAP